jgi:hypothetical protein
VSHRCLLERLAARLEWREGRLELPGALSAAPDDAARALEDHLYERLFTGWRPNEGRFSDSLGGAPHFTAALTAAIGEATWWAPGFRLESRAPAGCFVQGSEIRLFVAPEEVRPSRARRGAPVAVRLPCVREAAMPGYVCFNGRAGRFADDRPHLKVYANLRAAAAPRVLKALFGERALARVAFDGKVLNDPDAFRRRDTLLLYVDPRGVEAVVRVLRRQRAALRAEVPPFVLRVAPGLGVAESPLDSPESFGAHRCRLFAEGLVRWSRDGGDVWQVVSARFASEGLDASRPWLGALPRSWTTRVLRASA